mmetsp:Transcript_18206/g.51004  ORF Transcript_18206/g.51004 Transcript_18206/m.51004 type:complete len:139 (-) Transcript_18206:42-458(-)
MCVGLAVLCGPPTVACTCWFTWASGRSLTAQHLTTSGEIGEAGALPPMSAVAGIAAMAAAYQTQKGLVIRHFDEGGMLSYGYKAGTESLGEPLQIKTWGQFYRAAGPPVFARVGAIITSCFVAGAAQAAAAHFMAHRN